MRKIILCLFVLAACDNYIGEEYLGRNYAESPLGEAIPPDSDPLIRTDAFDCQTFVETSLAKGNLNKLTKIRYKDGHISFLSRNHFVETDWLQNNADLVENVSGHYAKTRIRKAIIDKKSWMNKVHKQSTDFRPQKAFVEYIPYENLESIMMPEDTVIVLFIAQNKNISQKIGTDLIVTHMGFLLPNGMLRHASQEARKVVDTNFIEYAANRAKNKNNLGVSLLEIKK